MVYSADRSKVMVPVLVLLFVALWFILRGDMLYVLCHFVLVFFIPFSITITLLGEERANLSAFHTFVRFVLVWICQFSLPLGVWEGLRFVTVALHGLFSYLLYSTNRTKAVVPMLVLQTHQNFMVTLGRAAVCDCGTPWTFLLPFF